MLGAIILATSATDKNEKTPFNWPDYSEKVMFATANQPVTVKKVGEMARLYAMSIPFTDIYFETIMFHVFF